MISGNFSLDDTLILCEDAPCRDPEGADPLYIPFDATDAEAVAIATASLLEAARPDPAALAPKDAVPS